MNILLTCIGKRNYIIDYFKKEIGNKGKVFTADNLNTAAGIYYADKSFIVPEIKNKNYIKILLKICKKNKVKAILSFIDPELSLLAKHSKKFEKAGIKCIVSNYDAVELCLDKYKFSKRLEKLGIPTIKTFKKAIIKQKKFPMVAKPRKGSASIKVTKVNNKKELEVLTKYNKDLIYQEFITGQEWGVDMYVDLISKKVINIFTKKKIKMVAGETDKAVSEKNKQLSKICEEVVKKLGLVGPIDIDCFETKKGFVISEINPRFGGGYPLAHACGVNIPKMIINNLRQITNTPRIGDFKEKRYMFKCFKICIKTEEELL